MVCRAERSSSGLRMSFFAALTTLGALHADLRAQERLFRFVGDAEDDYMGLDVSGVGDVNLDGVPDVAAVARRYARVYSCADGSVLFEAKFGDINHSQTSVGRMGDIDLDGFDDILFGCAGLTGRNREFGWAYVYSGKSLALRFALIGASGARFGYSVEGLGDLNADGYPDFIVGADQEATGGIEPGSAYVYSGSDAALLYTHFGSSDDESFGYAVTSVPDIDRDGISDYAVGAPRADGAGVRRGRAVVYSGRTGGVIRELAGSDDDEWFGFAVAGIRDLNQDGVAEFVVGSPFDSTIAPNNGRISVFSGADFSILYEFFGIREDSLGFAAADVGDMNRDGTPDLLCGAQMDYAAGWHGYARLYSGRTGSILYTWYGEHENSWGFGDAVSGAGDLDGDGAPEIVVGVEAGSTIDGEYHYGFIDVYTGNDLFQRADPREFDGGRPVTLTTTNGVPGQWTLLVITEVDGVPVNIPVLGLGQFDALGERTIVGTAPRIGVNELFVRAYAFDGSMNVIDTFEERLLRDG